jgi:hypothetical protein
MATACAPRGPGPAGVRLLRGLAVGGEVRPAAQEIVVYGYELDDKDRHDIELLTQLASDPISGPR